MRAPTHLLNLRDALPFPPSNAPDREPPAGHPALASALKALIDRAGALVGLLASAPLVALAALAIKLDSRGPVFFRQTRCGRDGREFVMWKLRTMVPDAETRRTELLDRNEMSGPAFKIARDPRVTPVGRFLRRYSLDELPQFWNVLVGDMSLVGPRPPLPEEVAQYGRDEWRRLTVKPGLTCTWQVSGRNEIDFDDWMRLDLDYVDRWSLKRDVEILLQTLPAVMRGEGAS